MANNLFDGKLMADNLPIGMFIIRLNRFMHILYANDSFYKLFGYTKQQALEKDKTNWIDYINKDEWHFVSDNILRALREGLDNIEFNMHAVDINNNELDVKVKGTFIDFYDDRVLEGIVCIDSQGERIKELEDNEERFRVALSQVSDVVWEYDLNNNIIQCADHNMHGISGLTNSSPEEVIKKGIIHPESVNAFLKMYEGINNGVINNSCVIQAKDDSGDYRWIRVTATTLVDDDNKPVKVIGLSREITKEKSAELRYIQEKEYRNSIASESIFAYEVNLTQNRLINGDSVWLKSLDINISDSYTRLLHAALKVIPNREHKEQFKHIFSREHLLELYNQNKREISFEYIRYNFDLIPRWVCATINLIQEPVKGDICAFVHIKDIDEDKKKALDLKQKAERDPLTGLYNRMTAIDKIEELINSGTCSFGAVLMIDIDHFKNINDTFGHVYGDAVLAEIAKNINKIVRKQDIVGRMGGDEMVVFLSNIPDEQVAFQKAEIICQTLHMNYSSEDCCCEISGSVGISFYPKDGTSFLDLYKKADIALYNAKSLGKNRYIVYNDKMSMENNRLTAMDSRYIKSFADNTVEYIFKILYETDNLEFAITSVLELIAKKFGVKHSYLVEYNENEEIYSMTFEWCESKSRSLKEQIKGVSKRQVEWFSNYYKKLDDIEVLNTSAFPETIRNYLGNLQVTTIFQCPINVKNGLRGSVGIVIYNENYNFAESEINDIKVCAEIIGTFLDNKRNVQRKEQYANSLKTVLDNLECYTYVVEPYSREIIFVNKKSRKVFSGAAIGRKCYETFMCSEIPCKDCPIDQLLISSKSSCSKDIYNYLQDMWLEATANWVDWPGENNKYCLVNCIDITRYKLAQTKAKEVKKELDNLISTIPGGYAKLIANDDFQILMASDGYYRLTGYSKNECLNEPINNKAKNFVLEEDLPILESVVKEMLRTAKPISVEYRIRKKDGSIAWNSAYCSGVQKIENNIIIEAIFIDTTSTKNMEHRLIRLINNIPCGFAKINADNYLSVDYASDGFYKVIGYSFKKFNDSPIYSKCINVIHEDDRDEVLKIASNFADTGDHSDAISFRIVTEDGYIRWIRASANRIFSGNKIMLECLFSDVTEKFEKNDCL